MLKIDFQELTRTALSAAGALLLTAGAMLAAAGPAEIGTGSPVTYANAAAADEARA